MPTTFSLTTPLPHARGAPPGSTRAFARVILGPRRGGRMVLETFAGAAADASMVNALCRDAALRLETEDPNVVMTLEVSRSGDDLVRVVEAPVAFSLADLVARATASNARIPAALAFSMISALSRVFLRLGGSDAMPAVLTASEVGVTLGGDVICLPMTLSAHADFVAPEVLTQEYRPRLSTPVWAIGRLLRVLLASSESKNARPRVSPHEVDLVRPILVQLLSQRRSRRPDIEGAFARLEAVVEELGAASSPEAISEGLRALPFSCADLVDREDLGSLDEVRPSGPRDREVVFDGLRPPPSSSFPWRHGNDLCKNGFTTKPERKIFCGVNVEPVQELNLDVSLRAPSSGGLSSDSASHDGASYDDATDGASLDGASFDSAKRSQERGRDRRTGVVAPSPGGRGNRTEVSSMPPPTSASEESSLPEWRTSSSEENADDELLARVEAQDFGVDDLAARNAEDDFETSVGAFRETPPSTFGTQPAGTSARSTNTQHGVPPTVVTEIVASEVLNHDIAVGGEEDHSARETDRDEGHTNVTMIVAPQSDPAAVNVGADDDAAKTAFLDAPDTGATVVTDLVVGLKAGAADAPGDASVEDVFRETPSQSGRAQAMARDDLDAWVPSNEGGRQIAPPAPTLLIESMTLADNESEDSIASSKAESRVERARGAPAPLAPPKSLGVDPARPSTSLVAAGWGVSTGAQSANPSSENPGPENALRENSINALADFPSTHPGNDFEPGSLDDDERDDVFALASADDSLTGPAASDEMPPSQAPEVTELRSPQGGLTTSMTSEALMSQGEAIRVRQAAELALQAARDRIVEEDVRRRAKAPDYDPKDPWEERATLDGSVPLELPNAIVNDGPLEDARPLISPMLPQGERIAGPAPFSRGAKTQVMRGPSASGRRGSSTRSKSDVDKSSTPPDSIPDDRPQSPASSAAFVLPAPSVPPGYSFADDDDSPMQAERTSIARSRSAALVSQAGSIDALGHLADALRDPAHVSRLSEPPVPNATREGGPQSYEVVSDEETGVLVIEARAGATVFLDGIWRGVGRVVVTELDRFATYSVRVHCAGFAPWSGTVSLGGEMAARVRPTLTAR